jgi:hypothetical protein
MALDPSFARILNTGPAAQEEPQDDDQIPQNVEDLKRIINEDTPRETRVKNPSYDANDRMLKKDVGIYDPDEYLEATRADPIKDDPNAWQEQDVSESLDQALAVQNRFWQDQEGKEEFIARMQSDPERIKGNLSGLGWGFGAEESNWIPDFLALPEVGAALVTFTQNQWNSWKGLKQIFGGMSEQEKKSLDGDYAVIQPLFDSSFAKWAWTGTIAGAMADPIFAAIPAFRGLKAAAGLPQKRQVSAIAQELARGDGKWKQLSKWASNYKGDMAKWTAAGAVAGAIAYTPKEDGRWFNAVLGAGAAFPIFAVTHGAYAMAKVGVRIGAKVGDKIKPERVRSRGFQGASSIPKPSVQQFETGIKLDDAGQPLMYNQEGVSRILSNHFSDDFLDMNALADPKVMDITVDNTRYLLNHKFFPKSFGKGKKGQTKRLQALERLNVPFHRAKATFKDDNHIWAAEAIQGQLNAHLSRTTVAFSNKVAKGLARDEDYFGFMKSYISHMRASNNLRGAKPDKFMNKASEWFGRIEKVLATKPHAGKPGVTPKRTDQDTQLINEAFRTVMGGRRRMEVIADNMANSPDIARFAANMSEWHRKGQKDALLRQVLLSNMLYNPNSWAANFAGNATFNAALVGEKFGAATISAMSRAQRKAYNLTRRRKKDKYRINPKDETYFREAFAELQGGITGAKQGLQKGLRVLMGKETAVTPASKFQGELRDIEKNLAGKVMTLPLRILLATDEAFKELRRHQVSMGMAARQLKMGKLKDSNEMHQFAKDVYNGHGSALPRYKKLNELMEIRAEEATFTRPLGASDSIPSRGARALQKSSQDYLLVKLAAPFVQAPYNIMGESMKRVPLLGKQGKWFGQEVTREGARRARDAQTARSVMASMVGITVASWAMDGTVIGAGPYDPLRAKDFRNNGYNPNSFILDKHKSNVRNTISMSFSKLEPLGWTLGVAATLGEMVRYVKADEFNRAAKTFIKGLEALVLDKTYIANLSALVKIKETGDMTPIISQLGSIFTPMSGALGAIDRLQDPIKRNLRVEGSWTDDPDIQAVNKIIDLWKSRMPSFFGIEGGNSIPPDVNARGQVLRQGGGVIMSPGDYVIDHDGQKVLWDGEFSFADSTARLFNSFFPVDSVDDVYSELLVNTGFVDKAPKPDINGVQLDKWQYAMLKMRTGHYFDAWLRDFVDNDITYREYKESGLGDRLVYKDEPDPSRALHGVRSTVEKGIRAVADAPIISDLSAMGAKALAVTGSALLPDRLDPGYRTDKIPVGEYGPNQKTIYWLDNDGRKHPMPADGKIADMPREYLGQMFDQMYNSALKLAKGDMMNADGTIQTGSWQVLEQQRESYAAKMRDRHQQLNYFPEKPFVPKAVKQRRSQ